MEDTPQTAPAETRQTENAWPSRLWIVRHGQSAGNVARDEAHAAGIGRIDLDLRDADVPLSDLGCDQAVALGQWFASLPPEQRPEVVLCSPYVRARQTTQSLEKVGALPGGVSVRMDERLREREFGILDRLTTQGIREHHPQQAELRALVGKFYHRPPGGESWCDVILRLRSLADTLSLHYSGRRVLIVAHQVVILCLRYLIEDLDEQAILEIDAEGDLANCSVTEYAAAAGRSGLQLVRYNFTAPLRDAETPVTARADAPVAAR